MSDAHLLVRAREGDEKALHQLLTEVQKQVYRFGMRMCRHPQDAEDVLQDTMLAVARNLETFREDSSLSTWVYSIARRYCIKKRRGRKHAPGTDDGSSEAIEEIPSPTPNQESELETRQNWRSVERALSTFDEDQREVLILRDVEGLSAAETAEVLGLSLAAMKSRLHRARRALRVALGTADGLEGCPDIVGAFSRKLEDELTSSACAEMEAHLSGCPRCRHICDAIRVDLRLCQTALAAVVPSDVAERIRLAVAKIPRFRFQP